MNHSRELNIVKAICIILMVIGHCDAPEGVTGFVYLFHMPAFFFVSGYLLKDKYFQDPWTFIKRRIGSLYVPYVFWELLFLALSGVFLRLHITDVQLTSREMLDCAVKYVTLRGHQPLLNGFWFLKTLFFASIACLFLLKWIRRRRWIIVVGMLLLAGLCRLVPADTTMVSRLFMACAFYVSGFLFSKMGGVSISVGGSIAAILAVAVISLFWRQSIFVDGWEVALYYPVAMLGTLAVFGSARAIDRVDAPARFLDFVGDSTLTILTFHFLSFKLVSLVVIWLRGLPIERLAEFPVIHDGILFTWPLYALVGVLFPLLVAFIRQKFFPERRGVVKLF